MSKVNEVNEVNLKSNQISIELEKLEKDLCMATEIFNNLRHVLDYVLRNRPSEKCTEERESNCVPVIENIKRLQDIVEDHISNIQYVLDNIVL